MQWRAVAVTVVIKCSIHTCRWGYIFDVNRCRIECENLSQLWCQNHLWHVRICRLSGTIQWRSEEGYRESLQCFSWPAICTLSALRPSCEPPGDERMKITMNHAESASQHRQPRVPHGGSMTCGVVGWTCSANLGLATISGSARWSKFFALRSPIAVGIWLAYTSTLSSYVHHTVVTLAMERLGLITMCRDL